MSWIKNPDKLTETLKSDEGSSLTAYTDSVGTTTIGVGRNLTYVGLRQSEVDTMLRNDIHDAVSHALDIFPGWHELPEEAQHVVVNMIFQLGRRGFMKFRRFISKIKAHDWWGAADEAQNSLAAQQAPERFQRHADALKSIDQVGS